MAPAGGPEASEEAEYPPQICVAFVKLATEKNLFFFSIFQLRTITRFKSKAGFTCQDTGQQDLEHGCLKL